MNFKAWLEEVDRQSQLGKADKVKLKGVIDNNHDLNISHPMKKTAKK